MSAQSILRAASWGIDSRDGPYEYVDIRPNFGVYLSVDTPVDESLYPMPKSLSDAQIRNSKPRTKPYKIVDGEGLFLLITPTGSKYWRLKYFFAGKEKLLALGVYPDVSLSDARDRRAQARKALAAGVDPGAAKKEAKRLANVRTANAFESVAREWHEKRKHEWAPNSAQTMLDRLERHIFLSLALGR